MRHLVDGRKFGTNTSHRKAIFKSLANSLIQGEQIITTVTKAKELRRVVDRLITLGKRATLASRRLAFDRTRDRDTVAKLFGELAKRYTTRNGGYTRVLRLDGFRQGDGAETAVIELVDRPVIDRRKKSKEPHKKHESTEDGESLKDDKGRLAKAQGKGHKGEAAMKSKLTAASAKPKSQAVSTVRKTSTRSSGKSGSSS